MFCSLYIGFTINHWINLTLKSKLPLSSLNILQLSISIHWFLLSKSIVNVSFLTRYFFQNSPYFLCSYESPLETVDDVIERDLKVYLPATIPFTKVVFEHSENPKMRMLYQRAMQQKTIYVFRGVENQEVLCYLLGAVIK